MKKPKQQLCFRIYTTRANGGFRHLTIELTLMEWIDAMDRVRDSLGQSYCQSYFDDANILRRETGVTRFLRGDLCGKTAVDVRWLESNDKPHEWFAPRIELANGTDTTIALLQRAVKAAGYLTWEATPRDWLTRLIENATAVPVKYMAKVGGGAYVLDAEWTLDADIPMPEPSESETIDAA